MAATRNAVIYARYSSDSQREESIEDQLRVCTDYAKNKGYSIVESYCDAALSGRTDARPRFQQMIADAANGTFEAVIVWKLDRFARDRFLSAKYKHDLKVKNVKVLSATEVIPDTIDGILLESLMEGMAEWYSANISQNVRRGMLGNALKCKANGMTLFGYTINASGYHEPDPQTAPYVQEMFKRRADGCGKTEIATWLNSRGIRTSKGNPWTGNHVSRLLQNQKYIGIYKYADIIKEGGMPALVDAETFWQVNIMTTRSKAKANHSPLTDKVFCGYCGEKMHGGSGTSKTGKTHHYFMCSGLAKKTCAAKRIPYAELEDKVYRATVEFFEDAEALEDLLDALEAEAKRTHDDSQLKTLKRDLDDNERRQKNLLDYLEGGSDEDVRVRLDVLRRKHAEITASIASALSSRQPPSRELMRFWIEDQLNVGSSPDKKRERVLTSFVSRVTAEEHDLVIEYNYRPRNEKTPARVLVKGSKNDPVVRREGFEPPTY
ncbi:MAG: recombinase family protein [Coriobacteriales bacterium]|nr:recombinase family protein [Coriobacteriales bacterium]